VHNQGGYQLKKIMVVGIGNLLMQDDGVGVHAIRQLEKLGLPEEIGLIDGGTHSYDLVDIFCEANKLIIVDAMQAGGEPGTIYRAPLEELGLKEESNDCISLHQLHFIDAMHMVNLLGHQPQAIVFGVEPAVVDLGLELSPEVTNKMPRLIELIQIEIQNLMSS
jgi:hydrogenase maturation protease